MVGKILQLKPKNIVTQNNSQEKEFLERIIWNIHDEELNGLRWIKLYHPGLIENSEYRQRNDKLYVINDQEFLTFKIKLERTFLKQKEETYGKENTINYYFRLDYQKYDRKELKRIGLVVKKPDEINYISNFCKTKYF